MTPVELAKSSIKLSLVVAMSNTNRGIGIKGNIPWHIPKDLKHFSRVTTFTNDSQKMNAVIMGRLTWNSIPKGLRPLPNRLNVVISSGMTKETCDANENADQNNILICRSFDEALRTLLTDYSDKIESIYAIGGTSIYREALKCPAGFLHRLYLTRVFADVECDTFLEPENFLDSFAKLDDVPDKDNFNVEFNTIQTEKTGLQYVFEIYVKNLLSN
jgi:dihydrofolate reductase